MLLLMFAPVTLCNYLLRQLFGSCIKMMSIIIFGKCQPLKTSACLLIKRLLKQELRNIVLRSVNHQDQMHCGKVLFRGE